LGHECEKHTGFLPASRQKKKRTCAEGSPEKKGKEKERGEKGEKIVSPEKSVRRTTTSHSLMLSKRGVGGRVEEETIYKGREEGRENGTDREIQENTTQVEDGKGRSWRKKII